MRISVEHEFEEMQRDLNRIARSIITKSTSQAINRTIESTRAELSRIIRSEMNLSVKYINEKLAIKKANEKKLTASFTTRKAKAVNLIEYVNGDIKRFRSRLPSDRSKFRKTAKKGVQARAYKKSTKQHYYKNTFIAKGQNSKKLLVFSRINKDDRNSKLKAIHAGSLRRAFVRPEMQEHISQYTSRTFNKVLTQLLQHKLDREIAKRR